ncbi:uncharacterized protein IL334_007281 [Kwoniella shivajii]|uniref:DUF6534 domain-containing protein n=1 Tax=Kwoniella shivajii TaxID=564305 RepID=A0ABZ1D884_9TREE|nr:hypothetical protein IL334_007281 [Kwoniella shivajii]
MSSPEEIATEQAAKAVMSLHHDLNLGTFIFAAGTDALLCGIMISQFISYWTFSSDDRKFNTAIVTITTLSSFCATLFIIVLMFKLFVYNFGFYAPFASVPLLTYMSVFDIIPSTATQIFFTHRVYKLTGRSKILLGLITLLILVSLTGAIGFPITQELYHTFYKSDPVKANALLQSHVTMTYLWLSGALGADVLITSSIMLSLMRSRTGWKVTDRTITKLIRVVVETQLPPTILLIVFFVLIFGYKDTYLDIFPLWTQSKFYTCGVLASLNSRYSLRRALMNSSSQGITPSKPPIIHVLTETYIQHSEATTLPNDSSQAKPRYLNDDKQFTPKRQPAKDPLDLDLDLGSDLDDASIKLNTLPTVDEVEGDGDSQRKMDYLEHGSKTALNGHLQ